MKGSILAKFADSLNSWKNISVIFPAPVFHGIFSVEIQHSLLERHDETILLMVQKSGDHHLGCKKPL